MQETVAKACEGNAVKEVEENHWTDDAELMERFVLHRLNPEELNELEDHLRICEVCKQAVRAEQVLVAGIRRGGRERSKASLRKQIAALPEQHTPWGRILSAAAVVIILLTVGVYNRWFEASNNDVVLTSPSVQEDQSTEKQAMRIPDQELSQPEESQTQSRQEAKQDARGESMGKLERKEMPGTATQGVASKEKDKYRDAPIAARDEMAASIASAESDVVWIEGTIFTDESDADVEKANREIRSAAPQITPKKYDSSTNAYGSAAQAQKSDMKGIANGISLSQQNSISLPAAQQQMHKLQNSAKVLTRLERFGPTTQLTLFLDSLVDETTLSNARLEMPRNDSLIVHLPNQRIAFKVPLGWNTQLQMKPAK